METKNCDIRKVSLDDYEDYYQIRSEPNNLFWTGYHQAPDFVKFKQWFINRIADSNKDLYLLFCNQICAGSLNIDVYDSYAYIGYSVKEAYAGKGLGTYVVKNAVEILKNTPNMKEVKAWINFRNIASVKVVEKNNFRKTGFTELRDRLGEKEEYIEFALRLSH